MRLSDNLADEAKKAIANLEEIVARLKARTSLAQFRDVDEFYYLQKIEELRLLAIEFEIAKVRANKLDQQLRKQLQAVAEKWDDDSRTLLSSC
jgi:hypothetical protein